MDFMDALHQYAVWHRTSGHSERTVAWYNQKLGVFIRWLQAHERPTSIEAITLADAREFILAEQQRTSTYPDHPNHKERPGALSDRTIDSYARVIKAFWNWLYTEEYISRNVMQKLKRPKLEQRFKAVVGDEDVARLLAQCNQRTFLGARLYAMICMLYDCGLRAGEVVNLNTTDVDMRSYQLRVVRAKGKKARIVPFGQATHKAVRSYLVRRNEYLADDPDGDALFVGKYRRRLTQNAVTQLIKKAGRRAGIPHLHPHLLRHSHAVTYLMNGGDQFSLKRTLGHSQLSTTDGYVDYAQAHLQQQHAKYSPMNGVVVPTSARRAKRKRRDT